MFCVLAPRGRATAKATLRITYATLLAYSTWGLSKLRSDRGLRSKRSGLLSRESGWSLIEHLTVGRTPYFYSLKRRLSQHAIDGIFRALRAQTSAPSQSQFKVTREIICRIRADNLKPNADWATIALHIAYRRETRPVTRMPRPMHSSRND